MRRLTTVIVFLLMTVLYGMCAPPFTLMVNRTNYTVAAPTNFWDSNIFGGAGITIGMSNMAGHRIVYIINDNPTPGVGSVVVMSNGVPIATNGTINFVDSATVTWQVSNLVGSADIIATTAAGGGDITGGGNLGGEVISPWADENAGLLRFNTLNPTQFASNQYVISIKAGANLTNIWVWGMTNTGVFTNSGDAFFGDDVWVADELSVVGTVSAGILSGEIHASNIENTGNMTNTGYLTVLGGTTNYGPMSLLSTTYASGPIYSFADSASNGPAANELPTAQWVRSLLDFGAFYWVTTNPAPTFTNLSWDTLFYSYETNIQTYQASRSYSNVVDDQYIGAVVVTNKLSRIQGPVVVNAYMQVESIAGKSTPVHPEIYFSYDRTNWFGDYDCANQTVTTGTNLYQFVVTFPEYIATNADGFHVARVFKVGDQTGNADLTFHVGSNTPAHLSFTVPASGGGDGIGGSNTTGTGSIVFSNNPYISYPVTSALTNWGSFSNTGNIFVGGSLGVHGESDFYDAVDMTGALTVGSFLTAGPVDFDNHGETVGYVWTCIDATTGRGYWSNSTGVAVTLITNANTVYLRMDGDDATAMRGRSDKPFLSISNAVAALQNGDTLLIYPGEYPALISTNHEVLLISQKTNVSIIGLGMPKIYGTNTAYGHLFSLESCKSIRFDGLELIGSTNRPGSPGELLAIAIELDNIGVLGNRYISIHNCRIRDWARFGICNYAATAALDSYLDISGNYFQNCGSTNLTTDSVTYDGAAIVLEGSNLKANANFIEHCFRGIEIYNHGTYVMQNVEAVGNTMVSNTGAAILLLNPSHGSNTTAIRISGNFIQGPAPADAFTADNRAIYVQNCQSIDIARNTIRDMTLGGGLGAVVIETTYSGAKNYNVAGNIVHNITGAAAMSILHSSAGVTNEPLSGVDLIQNTFSDCNKTGIEVQANDVFIMGNIFQNIGAETPGAYSAVWLRGSWAEARGAATNLVIQNNVIADRGAVVTGKAVTIGSITGTAGAEFNNVRVGNNAVGPSITALSYTDMITNYVKIGPATNDILTMQALTVFNSNNVYLAAYSADSNKYYRVAASAVGGGGGGTSGSNYLNLNTHNLIVTNSLTVSGTLQSSGTGTNMISDLTSFGITNFGGFSQPPATIAWAQFFPADLSTNTYQIVDVTNNMQLMTTNRLAGNQAVLLLTNNSGGTLYVTNNASWKIFPTNSWTLTLPDQRYAVVSLYSAGASESDVWAAVNDGSGATAATTLNGLTDVDTTGVANGQFLAYNTDGNWYPSNAPSAGSGQPASENLTNWSTVPTNLVAFASALTSATNNIITNRTGSGVFVGSNQPITFGLTNSGTFRSSGAATMANTLTVYDSAMFFNGIMVSNATIALHDTNASPGRVWTATNENGQGTWSNATATATILGVSNLNTLTEVVQVLQITSLSNDFGISSAASDGVGYHNFNLPYVGSSGAYAGRLLGSDWTNFNNKAPTNAPAFANATNTGTFTMLGSASTPSAIDLYGTNGQIISLATDVGATNIIVTNTTLNARVGINTNTPQANLHVVGNTILRGPVTIANPLTNTPAWINAANQITNAPLQQTVFYYEDNSSNVVVDMSIPYQRLDATNLQLVFFRCTNASPVAGDVKSVRMKIYTGPTNRVASFSTSWHLLSTNLIWPSNKLVIVSIESDDIYETNIVAGWATQQ